jgi:hypothetical protein
VKVCNFLTAGKVGGELADRNSLYTKIALSNIYQVSESAKSSNGS